jgi:hypothetical protein
MMQEAPLGADFTSLTPHADVPASRPTAGFRVKFCPLLDLTKPRIPCNIRYPTNSVGY